MAGGEGLPYKSGRDACCLAYGCKLHLEQALRTAMYKRYINSTIIIIIADCGPT